MKKAYLKPESDVWFYLQYMVYLQWIWWEWGKKTRKIYIHKKTRKNSPFGCPPIPPSIKLEADCFPAGYKDCDVISERGNPCRKAANKRDTAQGRTCPLIPKPAQEGLQRENIEKRRQRAALPDRTLDHDRPRTPSVHLRHCLRVVVHHANPSAELQFESGYCHIWQMEQLIMLKR